DVFLNRVPFAYVFVQLAIGSAQIEIDSFQLGLIVIQLLFGFVQPLAETLRGGALIGLRFFVLVFFGIVDGFRKLVILVDGVSPRIQIIDLLLCLFHLRFILLLLGARLLKLLLELFILVAIQ